ncbi:MAG TPA: DUF305 domain-containing protein [Longimicrobium sp.]|nr:DUF305 domain-containing protein [Longimicrobium sp.]
MRHRKTSSRWMKGATLLAAVLTAACGSATARAQDHAAHAQPSAHEADVRFVTGMIAHHAQALEMTALVPARASSEGVKMMAERIDVSQRDEIRLMEQWLRGRGIAVPAANSAHAHHGGAHARMPGMLAPEEMHRLAAASGAEFDRLFLELMIRHHEGALQMVAELFNTPGGGQATDVFALASEVDADQRMEIDRMRAMLGSR